MHLDDFSGNGEIVATITVSTMLLNAHSPRFSLNWPASILEMSRVVLISPAGACIKLRAALVSAAFADPVRDFSRGGAADIALAKKIDRGENVVHLPPLAGPTLRPLAIKSVAWRIHAIPYSNFVRVGSSPVVWRATRDLDSQSPVASIPAVAPR